MPEWHLHPDVVAVLAALSVGYWAALRALGPRHTSPGDPAASRGQVTAFALGMLALAVATGWPLHDLGEQSFFTAHMVQHLLLTLVAPPLLLLGLPGWLLRWLLPGPLLRAARFLCRPLVALVVFNAAIAVIHVPAFVDVYLRSSAAHGATHVGLVAAGLIMWMPVVSPIVEIARLSYPGQMFYLFLMSILPTVPASFLTFGSTPLYGFYEAATRPWGVSALADQRVAGLVMKIVGGLILWGVIAVIFFRWASEEESGVDSLGWREVERELHRREASHR